MITGGIIFSSLEYPGKVSLVLFTGGCPLRCPYCHNPEIIDGGESTSLQEIKDEIFEAADFVDAVVVTGGEPLMQFEDVQQVLVYAKENKLLTKIDTNGYYPERLKKIIKLVDYVALDIKAPFNKYNEIIGANIGYKVKKSMEICYNSLSFLECRTTYVPGLLDHPDILEIAKNIKTDVYTIQQFRNRIVLDEKLKGTPNTTHKELLDVANIIKPILGKVKIKSAEFGDEII